MKHFTKEITWLQMSETGWGNGYVCLPKNHALFGKDYDAIHELMPELEVHGGLTFASPSSECAEGWPEIDDEIKNGEYWIVGFDCAHAGDNRFNRSKAFVELETERLMRQLEAYKPIEA